MHLLFLSKLNPLRVQAGEIITNGSRRQRQADGPFLSFGAQKLFVEEVLENTAGCTFRLPGYPCGLPAGDFSTQQGFTQKITGFRLQLAKGRLPVDITEYAFLQTIQIEERGHEVNLVKSRLQEKGAKSNQPLVGQVSASIHVALAMSVGTGKRGQIITAMARQATRNSPHAMTVNACLDEEAV